MTQSFTRADLDDLAAILAAAADVEIMPRFKRLGTDEVTTKSGPQDFVTIADQAAERFIQARVAERFPTAVFIGEETTAADPTRLGRLAGAELAIIVDPIDGTFNFANGMPLFGVMAAVVAGGETVGAIIYDPIGRDFALAVKGEGAWLVPRDGGPARRLRVAAADDLRVMHGPVSWPYLPEGLREDVARRLPRLWGSYGYRNAAHEYRLLSSGGCHFLLYNRLMPWDHLPGHLIHTEAGGWSAHFDGTPYVPTDLGGGLLLAPDRESWQRIHDALFQD
ncbi:inositol monophosphatase family protein [Siculibacillus lacustris]|uniref:inositol monophosphatase family protein n=1 Tax=Siculibacillus lacustris TaxID=1549641 RepID=UPI001D188044|nr:inositol monophosphatase family protein [Siculibacillus lacustris]